jgi:tetratricopeptide (TPR) repeat protein
MALAHYRLGHIGRMLEQPEEAETEYKAAIAQFEALEREHPGAANRQNLANAYNWLGETLRPIPGRDKDAAAAYERALGLQSALASTAPTSAAYQQELARTHYNRGILRGSAGDLSDADARAAEEDFREAIRLLEPIASTAGVPQELARAFNNLGSLVGGDDARLAEAGRLYDRAISIHEGLVNADPANRQYKLELAKFYDNAAEIGRLSGDYTLSRRRNEQALELLDDLLRPAPSLGIEHADAHSLRGRILASARSAEAESAYRESLKLFDELDHDPAARRLAAFHQRFVDLLLNLTALVRDGGSDRARGLLTDAITHYIAHAEASLAAGARVDAQLVLDNLSRLLPELDDRDKRVIMDPYRRLERRLAERR